jgi:hypothetical protein
MISTIFWQSKDGEIKKTVLLLVFFVVFRKSLFFFKLEILKTKFHQNQNKSSISFLILDLFSNFSQFKPSKNTYTVKSNSKSCKFQFDLKHCI